MCANWRGTLDIYERCGVVHVDQEGARLYLFNMGVLENAEGYMGEEVKLHRSGGWANPAFNGMRPARRGRTCRKPPRWLRSFTARAARAA